MSYNWMPVMGKMEMIEEAVIFRGGKVPLEDREGSEIGLFICDQNFSGGSISVDVKFTSIDPSSCADIVLYYDPQKKYQLDAGLLYSSLFSIRHFDTKWTQHAFAGAINAIEPEKTYHLSASLNGSIVVLKADDVEVLRTNLPFVLSQTQVGLFCVGQSDIEFKNFRINHIRPKAFIVMQFSSPYNEVYYDVIKKICEEEEIDVVRIDEENGPGLVIQDITRTIYESTIVIADISPLNANVFYEVGFAHALNKPTILIAQKDTKLPFDVSSFRTLFYENSIGGKSKLEEGLRRNIKAILKQKN